MCPLIESLPATLLIAALVAVALIVYRRFDRRHPSPASLPNPAELTQGASILVIVCMVASAATAGVCYLVFGPENPIPATAVEPLLLPVPFAATLFVYIVTCAATGFYEEAAFRVVLQGLFERGFAGNGVTPRRCVLFAALLSSVLFAVMHVITPIPEGADLLHVGMQGAFKFLQGLLFGLVMTALLKRTGSLAVVAAIHMCYNLLFFLPWLAAAGSFPTTYLTGVSIDTIGLAITSICLVPAAVFSVRFLACGGQVQRPSDGESPC